MVLPENNFHVLLSYQPSSSHPHEHALDFIKAFPSAGITPLSANFL
jgi:hypothetical protein